MNAWAKQKNARQAAGLCRVCGKPRAGTSPRLCDDHRERELVQLKARRDARKTAGVCIIGGCGEPAAKCRYCRPHYVKQEKYHLKFRLISGRARK